MIPVAPPARGFSAGTLEDWGTRVLRAAGLAETDARAVASNVVDAELRGVRSHGLILLPLYVDRIRRGGIRRDYSLRIVRDDGSTVTFDADGGPGQPCGLRAMEMACDRAADHGVAIATMRNANHAGMLATYALRAARRGLVGLATTNSGPAVAAARGDGRLLGNQALCFALPAEPEPLVLDIATGQVACGRVRVAALEGVDVPTGWIVDREGRPTSDPTALDRGGWMLPFADHKGYGLAVVVDVLTGILSGGRVSLDVLNQRGHEAQSTGACLTFVAIDPDRFIGRESFARLVGAYAARLRSSTPREPDAPVLVPGDVERAQAARAAIEGLPLPRALVARLDALGKDLGVGTLA